MYRIPLSHPARQSCNRGYNYAVAAPTKPTSDQHQHRHHAYAAEAAGLLIIAVILLILTVVRYWSYIHWSVR